MSAASASSLQRPNQHPFYAAKPAEMFGDDAAYLRTARYERPSHVGKPQFRYVDLFSGCGGMSLGIDEAAVLAGFGPRPLLAVDNMKAAADVYQANLAPDSFYEGPIQDLLAEQGAKLSSREQELKAQLGRVDLIAGGPPCQGHSDLNNYSRRNDPKNSLYNYMARAAEVFEPTFILAENVQGLALVG